MTDPSTGEPTAPRPRPRLRLSVRALLALVAACALAMLLYGEFKDGSPPRFVMRGIPARIDKLKPGMTRPEARRILGLDRPWYRGGIGPTSEWTSGIGTLTMVSAGIRPRGPVPAPTLGPKTIMRLPSAIPIQPSARPFQTSAIPIQPSAATIHLSFSSDRLRTATYFGVSGVAVHMRKPR